MRKEAKQQTTTTLKNTTRIQGYHGGNYSSESYAFEGYQENYYFTSDRPVKLNARFERADGKPLKGYGLEFETECWSMNSNALPLVLNNLILKQFYDGKLFKLQRDGSLGAETSLSSAEIITQVMTKEFIRNNYSKWYDLFKSFEAFEISAARSGNCGMHCNISNGLFGKSNEEQMKNIRKFFKIVNSNFTLFCYLLKRDTRRTNYCGACGVSDYETVNLSRFGTHYNCFNFSHIGAGRIELRLVGGQKDFATFRNTMEVIFHLVERCKTISLNDCNDFVKIFKGCNKYVYDRLTCAGVSDYITADELLRIKESVDNTIEYYDVTPAAIRNRTANN